MIAETQAAVIRRELWHRQERAWRMRARDLRDRLDGVLGELEAAHLGEGREMTAGLDRRAARYLGLGARFLGEQVQEPKTSIGDVIDQVLEVQGRLADVMNHRRRWVPPEEEP